MAKKEVFVSDRSGQEIPEGTGASVTIKFHDPKKGVRILDITDSEAEELGGRQIKRRGRPPKATAAV